MVRSYAYNDLLRSWSIRDKYCYLLKTNKQVHLIKLRLVLGLFLLWPLLVKSYAIFDLLKSQPIRDYSYLFKTNIVSTKLRLVLGIKTYSFSEFHVISSMHLRFLSHIFFLYSRQYSELLLSLFIFCIINLLFANDCSP